ncbi:FAD-dependent oxidoreductase [Candidatus Microgenomates bacterium]|nr:FAD-dependent oxidoreductase [Candidatus Microgenomates bacterium]
MRLTLVKKQDDAKGTTSFFWKAEPAIEWKPGQYLYYTITLPEKDLRGNVRHFTISSSPTESEIRLTTKLSDSLYKKILFELPMGSETNGSGPRGDFVLDEERTKPQVFLAGGIGITPFRAFIKYAVDKGFKTPMHLIYSNSTPEEITFKEDLDSWTEQNKNFKVSYTITKPEESKKPWPGPIGRISADMISKLTTNYLLPTTTFWVCGPPAFTEAMEEELSKLKVDLQKIETEQFTGY